MTTTPLTEEDSPVFSVAELLKELPPRHAWTGCRLVMSAETGAKLSETWPAPGDDVRPSNRTLRLLADIPIFLDNALPFGYWRLLQPTGEEVARGGTFVEPIIERWRVVYSGFNGSLFITQARTEAEADQHVRDLANNRHIVAQKQRQTTASITGAWHDIAVVDEP